MGKRSLDDARTFGRSIQPTHDLQPEAGSADGDSVFAILDVNEIEADAQPKKITFTGVANVVGPLLTPTAIPAAGSNTQVQFNDGGFFGADGGLTYNKTTDALSAGAFIPTGSTVPTNGVYLPSANTVALSTNGVQRINIEADGDINIDSGGVFYDATNNRLAIGTSSPSGLIHGYINANAQLIFTDSNQNNLYLSGTNATFVADSTGSSFPGYFLKVGGVVAGQITANGTSTFEFVSGSSTTPILFKQSTFERARIDSSGRLLVGTSSARSNTFNGVTQGGALQVELSGGGSQPQAVFGLYSGGTTQFPGPVSIYGATRSTTVGGNTLVADNDRIALLSFQGNDGSEFVESASISVFVDGTPGTNDMPGRLVFSTTADVAASPTERFRITNDGVRGYNQPAPAAVDATATLTVANLKTGIITSSTAAAVTMTLPTGTLTEGGFAANSLYNNFTFEWTVINTGATNAVTVQGGTDHTLVGSGTIAAGVSGRFASRRTATNTFVTYRLS